MKKALNIFLGVFILFLSSCSIGQIHTPFVQGSSGSAAPYEPGGYGWNLVWYDEFDSNIIDSTKWAFDTGVGPATNGWGNNELEYYTSRDTNARVTNGNLVIQALQESYGGKSYTSARLKTHGKFIFAYGKIAARIKFPYGQGILPMFWMMGNNYNGWNWPLCGEMVVAEMYGGGGNSNHTVHSGMYWDKYGVTTEYRDSLNTGIPLHDSYHIFEIEWDSNTIVSRIDGRPYCSYVTTSSGSDVFQNPFFIILSLTVGGNWAGNPDGSTVFPQTMEVDWVRVYQKSVSLPMANITYPQDATTVYGSFPVMGVSSGSAGIKNTCLSVDHSTFIPFSDPTNWFSNLNLSAGMHNLRVYTVDLSNQTSETYEMNVTVTWTKPTIKFTYVPGYTNNEMVHGTVSGVSPSLYKISLWIYAYYAWWPKPYYPAPYTAIQNDGSWSTIYNTGGVDGWADNFTAYLVPSYMPVFPGTQIRTEISNYIITYGTFNRGDMTGPSNVHFITPTNGQTIVGRLHTYSFTGSFSDDIGGGTVQISVNGSPYTETLLPLDYMNTHATNWCDEKTLADGYNTVSVYAMDDGYRCSSTNQITVFFINDDTPPAVLVTSPLNNQHYAWPGSVNMTGTSSDANGVLDIYLQMDNLGFFKANGTISWDLVWPFLDRGTHVLQVYGRDMVTNYTPTNSITFYVD